MTVLVATRMKVGKWRHLPAFLGGSLAAAVQAAGTPGFVDGRLRVDASGAFWTLTLWRSDREMAVFRDSGVHAKVAPRLAGWACEGAIAAWQADTADVPPWAAAAEQISAQGNFAALDAPSQAHLRKQPVTAQPRGLEFPIRPWGGKRRWRYRESARATFSG